MVCCVCISDSLVDSWQRLGVSEFKQRTVGDGIKKQQKKGLQRTEFNEDIYYGYFENTATMSVFGNVTLSPVEEQLFRAADVAFLLLTGANILMMQVGFMGLEVGATRAKSSKSLMYKNFLDLALASLVWFTFGYGIFGGTNPFASGAGSTFFVHNELEFSKIFQQFGFAATAITIVSGAVTPRMRIEVYAILSVFLTGITYAVQAHWCWSSGGWLFQQGFLDFAGSGVVHGLGGSCALIAAHACGPRVGRFVANKKTRGPMSTIATIAAVDISSSAQAGKRFNFFRNIKCTPQCWSNMLLYQVRNLPGAHNPALQTIGAMFLFIGWFSFNFGSSGSIVRAPDTAQRAALNTLISAGASLASAFVYALVTKSKYDLSLMCNSLLAGLAAITAPCGYVDGWAAIAAGSLSFPILLISDFFVLRVLGIDDPLQAASVHGGCGFFGVLWLGLTHPTLGLFYGGGLKLLGVQALGCLCIAVWGMTTTALIVYPARWLKRISYSDEEQLIGIDFVHFSNDFGEDVDMESGSRHSRGNSQNSDEHSTNNSRKEDDEFSTSFADISNHNIGEYSSHGAVTPDGMSPRHSRMNANTLEGRKELASEMKRVMYEDPQMRKRFRAFLAVMHREEGVDFWDAVVAYRKLTSKSKRVLDAKRVITEYCLVTGSKQVNLSSSKVNAFRALLESNDSAKLSDESLFDEAVDEMFRDLKTSFSDFVTKTPQYWL